MHALVLHYRLRDSAPDTPRAIGEALAAELAGASELVALCWLAGERPDQITGVVTFGERAACERFAQGPSLARLRADPHVAAISVSTHAAASGQTAARRVSA